MYKIEIMSQNQDPTQFDQVPRYYTYQEIVAGNYEGKPMDLEPGAVVWGLDPVPGSDKPFNGFDLVDALVVGALKRTQPIGTQWDKDVRHHVSRAAVVSKFYGTYKDLQAIIVPTEDKDAEALAGKFDLMPGADMVTVLYAVTLHSTAGNTPVATKRVYAISQQKEANPQDQKLCRVVTMTESSANAVWQASLERYQQTGRAALVAAMSHPYHGGAFEQGKRS